MKREPPGPLQRGHGDRPPVPAPEDVTIPSFTAATRGPKVTPMPEYDDIDDDDTNEAEGDQVTLSKAEHDDLRAKARKAKKADEATTTALAAQRELAFVKAGVDTDSPIGKLLLAGYTGELTAEAIKAEAVSVGAIEAEVPDNPEITDEEKQSTDERADLGRDAQVGAQEDPDPVGTALKAGRDAIDAGANEETAGALTFRGLASEQRNWQPVG